MECDGCTACCKILPIYDKILVKEQNTLCKFCDKGCTIYEERPISCVNFNCVYITDGYGETLRPDKSGVIFEKVRTKIFLATVDKDFIDAWKTQEMIKHIQNYNDDGISVVVSSFSNGLIDVYCAENHDRDIVIKLTLQEAKRHSV